MRRFGSGLAVAVGALALNTLLAPGASAAGITYDAMLTSPDTVFNPGFYNGSGNVNGGFTLWTGNGIELGLRAKQRQGPITQSATNLYQFPTGQQPGAPVYAFWNYEFSINLQPLEVGDLTLSQVTAQLLIEDLMHGGSATVNPLTYWADNSGWGPSDKRSPVNLALDWGAQNSENPVFADFPLSGFNMNADNYFRFTLSVLSNNTIGAPVLLGATSIDVQVGNGAAVPEPTSMLLLGTGLVGVAARRRRNASR